jgi:hypothetical protein
VQLVPRLPRPIPLVTIMRTREQPIAIVASDTYEMVSQEQSRILELVGRPEEPVVVHENVAGAAWTTFVVSVQEGTYIRNN